MIVNYLTSSPSIYCPCSYHIRAILLAFWQVPLNCNADIEAQLPIWSMRLQKLLVGSLFIVFSCKDSKRLGIYPCLYA